MKRSATNIEAARYRACASRKHKHHKNSLCLLCVSVANSPEYKDNFTRFDEFEFFARELFNRVGVGAKGLDFGGELLVFVLNLPDFAFDHAEFIGLGADLNEAFVVE